MQHLAKKGSGRTMASRDGFRRALRHDGAASGATFRADVHDVVSIAGNIQLVLDDQNGVALIHEPVEHLEQHVYILEVQACGGFVQA